MKPAIKNILALFTGLVFITSCSKEPEPIKANKVLMLKVDYLTNTFEGGKEFTFTAPATTFSIAKDYKVPGDAGYLKLKYQELNEPLFDGGIIWAGLGKINFPQDLRVAGEFDVAATTGIVNPVNGFENIFDVWSNTVDYTPVWLSIQKLVKVREYLASNPDATVKLFLYTPRVGALDLSVAKWIIVLKN